MRRNLDIDRLRAVAILLVLLSHLPLLLPADRDWNRLISRLWVGVDLFFCISGFVVAGALVPKLDRALAARRDAIAHPGVGVVLKAFFIRRAFRILPLSWLWLVLLIVATMTYNASGAFGSGQTARDAVPSILTYWNNIWAALHRTQLIDAPSPVAVYWSLSTEEQFYLLFPLLLTVFTRPRWRAAVLVLLIVVQFPLSRPVWSTGWLVRFDAIAWGVCLYLFAQTSWHRRFEPTFLRSPWTAAAIAAVAVLLLSVLVALPREWAGIVAPFPGTVGIIALACAVLVFVASYDRDYVLSIPGLRKGLDWFGTRSYGLYLAHLPVYMASREFWYRIALARGEAFDLRWNWVLVATGIVALVVVTEVLHRTVESPLRQRGRRWAAKTEGRARGAQVGTQPG